MASGIFAILDDIAALMDDVAVAAKIATKKTAGILGDDLAVNAEKATGFISSREIPVLWEITKGSLVNKLIIVPVVLLLNYYLPFAITIILILGGFYLAYEGVEKIIEYVFHKKENDKQVIVIKTNELADERTKIKSAITTDFILSIEIVIIALGTVLNQSLVTQIGAIILVALLATFGVYGIVAIIVRMDDTGYKLMKKSKNKGILAQLGKGLVISLPIVIRLLAVIGTIALILVSGGIFAHNVDILHHVLPNLPSLVREFGFGLVAGLIMVVIIHGIKLIFQKNKKIEGAL